MTSHIPPSREDLIAFFMEREPHTVHHALNIRTTNPDPDAFTVEVDVSERLFQHAGIVHGGIYVLLAESAASGAAAFTVDVTKYRVAGQEISASHVRASTSGVLRAVAKLVHKGRTQLVYSINVENDGRVVSIVRCTIAVRPINE
jgi:1,4-dihydroxy-2-naphthoyl-CoA hydrolase